jgi:hypothetical protein
MCAWDQRFSGIAGRSSRLKGSSSDWEFEIRIGVKRNLPYTFARSISVCIGRCEPVHVSRQVWSHSHAGHINAGEKNAYHLLGPRDVCDRLGNWRNAGGSWRVSVLPPRRRLCGHWRLWIHQLSAMSGYSIGPHRFLRGQSSSRKRRPSLQLLASRVVTDAAFWVEPKISQCEVVKNLWWARARTSPRDPARRNVCARGLGDFPASRVRCRLSRHCERSEEAHVAMDCFRLRAKSLRRDLEPGVAWEQAWTGRRCLSSQ